MKTILEITSGQFQLEHGRPDSPCFIVRDGSFLYKMMETGRQNAFDNEVGFLQELNGLDGFCELTDYGYGVLDGSSKFLCIKVPYYGKDIRKLIRPFTSASSCSPSFKDALCFFSPERVIRLMTDITSRFVTLERLGILHNDIAPQNIIVSPQGTVTIIDFGSALHLNEDSVFHVDTNCVIEGHRDFNAPEKVREGILSFQSDIYSVGKVLNILVHTGKNLCQIQYPEPLLKIRSACLESRERRYSSFLELSEALDNCQAISPVNIPVEPAETARPAESNKDDEITQRPVVNDTASDYQWGRTPSSTVVSYGRSIKSTRDRLVNILLSVGLAVSILVFAGSYHMAHRTYSEEERDVLEKPNLIRDIKTIMYDLTNNVFK